MAGHLLGRSAVVLLAVLTLLVGPTTSGLVAQGRDAVLFGGLGGWPGAHATPWVLGFEFLSLAGPLTFGSDIAGEGALDKNTNGSSSTGQGFSVNVLVGVGVPLGTRGHLGVSGLLGRRRTEVSCPKSYIGLPCYADQAPEEAAALNVGGMAHLAYRSVMVGVRQTRVSTQLLFGVAF